MTKGEKMEMIFGTKDREATISGENFFIGNGMIKFEHQTVPFEAISLIDVTRQAAKAYIKFIITFFILIILTCVFWEVYGMIFFAAALMIAGMLVYRYMWNQNRGYYLDIYSHAGYRLRIEYQEIEFLFKLKGKIEECIKNSGIDLFVDLSEGKVDMSGSVINGDVMTGETRKYSAGGDIITDNGIKNDSGNVSVGDGCVNNYGSGSVNTENQVNGRGSIVNDSKNGVSESVGGDLHMSVSETIIITDKEWQGIMEFASARKNDYPKDSRNFKICNNIQFYAKNRDINKLKELVKKVGKITITSILETCTSEAIKNIILLLLG